jgi:ankyrin repeat protein
MTYFTKLILLWTGWCIPVCCQEQGTQMPSAIPEIHVQQLIASLAPASKWRPLLNNGARGDGIRHLWMDSMQQTRVRLAAFTFEFSWTERGKSFEDWRVVQERYFRDYDSSELVLPQQTSQIEASGLEHELEEAALSAGKGGHWLECPQETQGTGFRQVLLADNEWLPVGLSPFFGAYEPRTTPLMHAALLGDSERLRKLISHGAQVDATSRDGSTALTYAAASDNPVAVETLLKEGANVNAGMKHGGAALTAAVVTNHPRNVELLLKAGADPNVRNVARESLLLIANREHYIEIVELLIRAGAQ